MSMVGFLRALALILIVVPLPALACSGSAHIELTDDGVYTLDQAAVVAAQPGLDDCAVKDLVLTQAGNDVPIRIVAAGDIFSTGDLIEWVGHALHGPESWYDAYSVNNVYLLAAKPGAHARMREAADAGSGHATLARRLHLEQENQMIRLDQTQQRPGDEPDIWQWAKMTQVDPKPFSTRIDLPDLDARGGKVKLTLNFRGLSELDAPPKHLAEKPADHRVDVTINGHAVTTLLWDGRGEIRRDLEVSAALLKAHANTLEMHVPKRTLPWDKGSTQVDVVMFNWIEARYAIAGNLDASSLPFEVRADASAPLLLDYHGTGAPMLYGDDGVVRAGRASSGGRYAFAPAAAGVTLYPALSGRLAKPVSIRAVADVDWMHPAHPYDYLIVAHPSLIDAIKPLAAFHEARGMKVAIIDVNAVYDEFNNGITHPRAIRNLVDAAYHQWPAPRPRFLLLVGDSSYDIRHTTYSDTNYAKWVDQELLYPNGFGAIGGTPYKVRGKSLADRNLIPTFQYPSAEGQSASDNAFASVGIDWHPVIAVGRFPVVEPAEVKAIVDKTIDYLSKPQLGAWRRDVMFITDEIDSFKKASDEIATALGKDGFLADKVYASPKEANNLQHQTAIRDGIDDGRLIVHFIGHGGRYIWRTGPPDLTKNHDLFTLDDVSSLKNGDRLPMVLSMTCYSAPFDNPAEDSIGEKFLREPNRGAIAVFAASWRNSPSPTFSKGIISELLKPGATIGEAIMRAKQDSNDRTLVEMYNLLGDPAVVLERPRDEARVMRAEDRWSHNVLVDLGVPRFSGNVRVDWLDAKGRKLASADYHTDQTRFQLAPPASALGKVGEVRVYAASPTTGRDAVGGVDFVKLDSKPAKPWRQSIAEWWNDFTRPPYKPRQRSADTIAIMDFDDPHPDRTQAAEHAPATATPAASSHAGQ